MSEAVILERAERIRDVIRYIKRFKNALAIIYLDETLLDSPVFLKHIKDICFIHEAGIRIILVPGASRRIDQVLANSGIEWSYHDGDRITDTDAMPLIKMAAFDVSNQIMTALAGERKTAVIGNWVRARGKGVINGFDYATSGEIERLELGSIRTVLENDFIPIFPCIGWSAAGKPYNISSVQLAQQIALHFQADKLFYLVPDAEISSKNFNIPAEFGVSQEGTVPAMNLEELEIFFRTNGRNLTSEQSAVSDSSAKNITEHSEDSENSAIKTAELSVNSKKFTSKSAESSENSEFNATEHLVATDKNVSREKIFNILKLAKDACEHGVTRAHLVNGSIDGCLPCEIFSDLGSGTMIYRNNYGGIRNMSKDDITAVLSVMQPFIAQGILLPRNSEMLAEQYVNYIVYELDGAIKACASLIPYNGGQMEIAGIAVEKTCAHMGIGPKLVSFLIERAKRNGANSIFILTTQTADWFEKLGFRASEISTLPPKRKELWSPERGSKLMRLDISSQKSS